jgi:hypothetical protein
MGDTKTEPKKKRKVSGSSWLVVTETDGLLTVHYAGKDRIKARTAVEENLGKKPVSVMKVARVSTFTTEDLEPRLVKTF